uniref:Uncharacterized protein n=1 Tax=Kalanchoe fedtschenkoi TaxID=63787 RepID=A0A7N0V5A1_KALFE
MKDFLTMAGLLRSKSRFLHTLATKNFTANQRAFFAAGTGPLQDKKKDEEATVAYEKVTEAANALQDAAKEKRKTSESVREAVATTASTVTKMSKEVSEKVCKTADHVSGKAKDTIWETAKATAGAVANKLTKD